MNRALGLYRSTIGKKVVMALTGAVLFGYTVGHMLGNLQIFLGPAKIDAYARFLHETKPLLWGVRAILLVSAALHVRAAAQLAALQRAARPIRYRSRGNVQATYASRTMMLSGPFLLLFVVFHILHLTLGVKTIDPQFAEGEVFANVVRGFQAKGIAFFYLAAMSALGLHLSHGAWSMFQSIGVNHPRINRCLRDFAAVATVAVAGGFALVPLAVLLGFVTSR